MLFGSLNALAQETFDVVTYTPPAGWEKEDLQGQALAFTRKDERSGTWARIALYKSVKGSGNLQSDFASEWNLLAAKPYNAGQPSGTEERVVHNGWRARAGLAQFTFDNAPAGVSLSTISNGDRTLSVLVLLNSNIHQKDVDKFMASLRFPSIAAPARAAPLPQADPNTKPRIVGNWNHSSSSSPQDWKAASWSGAGYTTRRYEFKEDGTYRFTMRSFFMMNPDIYIVKEHGTFTVSGNQLTVVPQSSVFETYLKKNNADELGRLKATQKRSLDTVTYATTLHFSPGMREWNLVLQASKPTVRDGSFDNNTAFANAWYFNQRFDAELTSPTGKQQAR